MKFSQLAKYFQQIEDTSSRLTITNLLAELYKKLSPDEIEQTTYLLQGRVLPSYEKVEFGIAERMIIKAVVLSMQLDRAYFEKEFKKIGDLGVTAEHFKKQYSSFEERDLTIGEVYQSLYKMATAGGAGSQEVKMNYLASLVRQLDGLSVRYLVRIPQGVMRLGFSDMTVLDAFSWMITGDKSLRKDIQKAYHVRPDLGFIGKVLKEKGIKAMAIIQPKIFTPIIMMRAERLPSGKEIVKQIGECAIEPKYDGFRLQIHYSKEKNEVRLYSRNLEEVSFMYPDIVEAVKKEVKAKECIFEGEAIGYNPQLNSFLPFQETVQRKRKYDIEMMAIKVPLRFFAFELLYADGVNYIHSSFTERRKRLEKIIDGARDVTKDSILPSPQEITADEKRIEVLFDEAISKGLEGIIGKKLSGIYQPGARGWNWIKLKRSYTSLIDDTIDCLVMGYDYGKGKRTDFGMGAFLVGIYDEKKDVFVTIAKIGTGLTDEEWRQLKVQSSKLKVQSKPVNYNVDKMMECDVWIAPALVMEIRADEITRSPVHTAGRIMKTSKSGKAYDVDTAGFALRFPRLERFRDDKKPEDITTLLEVEKMFKSQGKNSS